MNLKAELEDILGKMKTAAAVYIMDADGLVVERAETKVIPDLETVFIEFMQGYRFMNNSSQELNMGPVQEICITTTGHRYLIRRINAQYFLVMAMSAGGFPGEGFYRLRRAEKIVADDFTL
jgi:predicted regulator of Ras-like GTPase activity (Roadblock/LC7/MglB family)